jgi:hypothetical protein
MKICVEEVVRRLTEALARGGTGEQDPSHAALAILGDRDEFTKYPGQQERGLRFRPDV